MVEQRDLNDYKPGDWIGIHYQEPGKLFYCFPTIVKTFKRCPETGLDDSVEVELAPQNCPVILNREYISRIWRVGEVSR